MYVRLCREVLKVEKGLLKLSPFVTVFHEEVFCETQSIYDLSRQTKYLLIINYKEIYFKVVL